MSKILNGKVAVITGGSRGLGLAIAQTYARAGAKIVIASRSKHSVDAAVENLRKTGAQATGLACDVADITRVEELAELAIRTFGRIDIWVNNAGRDGVKMPFFALPKEDYLQTIQTNMVGLLHCKEAAVVPQRNS